MSTLNDDQKSSLLNFGLEMLSDYFKRRAQRDPAGMTPDEIDAAGQKILSEVRSADELDRIGRG